MLSFRFILLVAVTLCAATVFGQQPDVRRVLRPEDAAAIVLADRAQFPPAMRANLRYLWMPNPTKARMAALSLTINSAVSRSATPYLFTLVGDGIARIDLGVLAPNPNDLLDLVFIWDRLAGIDPYFHIGKQVLVETEEFLFVADGKKYRAIEDNRGFYAPHLGELGLQLQVSGGRDPTAFSDGGLLRADWFVTKAMTTLNGGVYYRFIGVIDRFGNRLTQQQYFKKRGVDENLVANTLDNDKRAAVVISGVTGRGRRVDLIRGLNVAVTTGLGLIAITHDPDDDDEDETTDPIVNLAVFKDAGREIIMERRNGLHEFFLSNGNGVIVDEAPGELVSDHAIPAPHVKRLQPGMSCIRCHGPEDGWKKVNNDVPRLVGEAGGPDAFADLSLVDKTVAEQVEFLVSRYSDDLEPVFMLGRNSYANAVFKVTGGMQVPEVSQAMVDMYNQYWLDPVTPEKALYELGLEVKPEIAKTLFRQLLPPVLAAPNEAVRREDNRIVVLKAGLGLKRRQFERVYVDAAVRSGSILGELTRQLQLQSQPEPKDGDELQEEENP